MDAQEKRFEVTDIASAEWCMEKLAEKAADNGFEHTFPMDLVFALIRDGVAEWASKDCRKGKVA